MSNDEVCSPASFSIASITIFRFSAPIWYLSILLSPDSDLVGSLPVYENLRRLKLVIHDCFCWELLTELLKRSPLLESLVLERKVGCQLSSEDSGSIEGSDHEEISENEQGSYVVDGPVNEQGSEHEVDSKSEEGSEHKEGSDHEDGLESVQGSEHQWIPPDAVPRCCWLHLKFVSIEKFRGNREELEVAKYLLQHGHVMNKMTISMDNLNWIEKEKIYEEILWHPRASRTSRVEFISEEVL